MKNLKLLAFLLLLAPCSLPLRAQSTGTISSYSRFGLGVLHDQSNGLSKSMGGVGAGVRVGNRINSLNPASYSAIDSLSLILDVGMSGSFGKMNLGAKTVGVNSATLDYVHVGMHIAKRLGLAAGFSFVAGASVLRLPVLFLPKFSRNADLLETAFQDCFVFLISWKHVSRIV